MIRRKQLLARHLPYTKKSMGKIMKKPEKLIFTWGMFISKKIWTSLRFYFLKKH